MAKNKGKKAKPKKDIQKINVNFEDEINFVADEIRTADEDRVLVTIPAGSDLLVSTVSLELLAEVADMEGKDIVVVTDDEGGRTLAKTVGVTVRASVSQVDDEVWKEAVSDAKKRKIEEENRKEWATDTGEGVEGPDLVPMDASSIDVQEEQWGSGVTPEVGSSRVAEESSDDIMDDQGTKKIQLENFEMTVDKNPIGEPAEQEDSMSSQIKPEVKRAKDTGGKGFVGRDFSNYKIEGMSKDEKEKLESERKPISEIGKVNESKKNQRGPIPRTALDAGSRIGDGETVKPLKDRREKKKLIDFSKIAGVFKGPGKWKKILIIVGIIFLLLAGGTYGASRILPEAVVTLEISSVPVNYEGEITADIDQDGVDEDDLVIPAKVEEVEKNGSDTANTTGVEERGEKATGTVLVFNKYIEEEIVLNAGTIIRNGGLNFVLQNSVVLDPVTLENPATMGESDITAQEIGSEYNLASGTQFSVGDYEVSDVYATNTEAFSGGSSEEYRVVTAGDINDLVEGIQETLDEEAENELKAETENSRWVIVDNSVEHELAEDPTSSAPAGAEADSIDVSIETVSKAIYYDKNRLDQLIEILLIEDFDGQVDELELSDNVEQTVTVKAFDLDEGTITLSVTVDGYVMPQLNEDEIQSNLVNRSWTEGIKYLENMDYVSEDYDLKYFPEWMPEFLWRMPSSKDKIRVKVNNVTPEEEEETDPSTGSGQDESETTTEQSE